MFSQKLYKISFSSFLPYLLLFLYFVTLSADKLYITLVFFRLKANHLLSLMLIFLFLPLLKQFFLPRMVWVASFWICLSIFISSLFSPLISRSLGYFAIYCFEFISYFLLPLLCVVKGKKEAILRLYFLSFILVGTHAFLQLFFSIFGIYDPFLSQFLGRFARAHAWAYEPSFYALYMGSFVMFYNLFFLLEETVFFNVKNFFSLLFVNLFLVISTSTGGFFAYFVLLGVSLFFSFFTFLQESLRFLRKKMALFSTFLVFLFGSFAFLFPRIFLITFFKFFNKSFTSHGCFSTRWDGIVNAWKVFLENPFFGVGLGGVGPYLHQERVLKGSIIQDVSLEELLEYDPTNVLTEVLASLGLFGLFGFILLGIAFYILFKKAVQNPNLPSHEKNQLIALFLSLIVTMCVLQFNQNIFRNYLWVHASICLGLFLKASSLESLSLKVTDGALSFPKQLLKG